MQLPQGVGGKGGGALTERHVERRFDLDDAEEDTTAGRLERIRSGQSGAQI